MLHYTPPQLVEMNSSNLSPFTKPKRFSASTSSHDKQHAPQSLELDANYPPPPTSQKRSSKLGEFMSRARTASLPPRPHSSSGPSLSRHKLSARLGSSKGKGKEKGDLLSPDSDGAGAGEYVLSAAASSTTSGKCCLPRFIPGLCRHGAQAVFALPEVAYILLHMIMVASWLHI